MEKDTMIKLSNLLTVYKETMIRFLIFVDRTATAHVLEFLFALNYVWMAFVSILPYGSIQSSLLNYLYSGIGQVSTILLFFCASFLSLYALYKNIIWLRQALLLLNIVLCFLSATIALFLVHPPGAGAGFLLILAALSCFASWKISIKG